MLKQVFEKTYTQYSVVQKVKVLAEYLDKIPGADTKKFVKMLIAGKNGFGIYNISGIEADEDGKQVKIIYTGDEASKAMTMKAFAKECRDILAEDAITSDTELVAELEDSSKGYSFRFYYDNSKNYALFVRNTNVKGLEEFLANYEGDLAQAVELPKTRMQLKGKAKKDKPVSGHAKMRAEGYVKVAAYDDFGHRIIMWKKEV